MTTPDATGALPASRLTSDLLAGVPLEPRAPEVLLPGLDELQARTGADVIALLRQAQAASPRHLATLREALWHEGEYLHQLRMHEAELPGLGSSSLTFGAPGQDPRLQHLALSLGLARFDAGASWRAAVEGLIDILARVDPEIPDQFLPIEAQVLANWIDHCSAQQDAAMRIGQEAGLFPRADADEEVSSAAGRQVNVLPSNVSLAVFGEEDPDGIARSGDPAAQARAVIQNAGTFRYLHQLSTPRSGFWAAEAPIALSPPGYSSAQRAWQHPELRDHFLPVTGTPRALTPLIAEQLALIEALPGCRSEPLGVNPLHVYVPEELQEQGLPPLLRFYVQAGRQAEDSSRDLVSPCVYPGHDRGQWSEPWSEDVPTFCVAVAPSEPATFGVWRGDAIGEVPLGHELRAPLGDLEPTLAWGPVRAELSHNRPSEEPERIAVAIGQRDHFVQALLMQLRG